MTHILHLQRLNCGTETIGIDQAFMSSASGICPTNAENNSVNELFEME